MIPSILQEGLPGVYPLDEISSLEFGFEIFIDTNMRVTLIPVVVGALGKTPVRTDVQKLQELKKRRSRRK